MIWVLFIMIRLMAWLLGLVVFTLAVLVLITVHIARDIWKGIHAPRR